MIEGNIAKQLFFFSIPLILGNLLQQLYNTADSIVVGNFVGSNALAAVGSGTVLINLIIAFSQGTAVGAGVVIAQYIGAKHKEKLSEAVHTSVAIALIIGAALSLFGVLFSKTLLIWMKTPKEVLSESVVYLRIYFAGLIFNVIYNMAAGIMNAAGNSKRSLRYLAYASVTNIILDLLFVGLLKMGIMGAALATDISQLLSGVLSMLFLMRVNEDYKVTLKKIKLHKESAKKIIRVGLPTGLQNTVISISNVLVQSGINGFGATAMAGFGAYLKVDGFNILPVLSFSMAATTFVGQNYGAGKIDRVKKGMWITLGMVTLYTIVTGVLLLTFSNQIIRLFSADTAVIAYGADAMKYFCPFYFVLGILNCLAGTVRGTGKTMPPMIIMLISMCIFRIFWIQLALPRIGTIEGIYMLYPISWAIGAAMMVLYTIFGKWIDPKKLIDNN
ncbi:MAG: MATE family efflux transporter [Oscillospiraceae bacterium]|nr:MATE family efflux transporter [Oscillospiraceae bacterium]